MVDAGGWFVVFDPAWDMPQLNWQQQGCYEQGSIPPVVEPDAGTQVWLGPVAREWLPWICGSLDQMRNPSSWIVADETAMYNTLRRVDTLLGLVCGNGGSQNPVMLRLENCVLQTSSDGGATWVDVSGWTTTFADCVRTALPPPPPPLGPGPIQQHACNLAGYLATEIVRKSLQSFIDSRNANVSLLQAAANLSSILLAEALPYANLFIQLVNDVYPLVTMAQVGQFQTAVNDPLLWSEVTCAIFNAIKNQGAITDGNYGTLVANVCAIVYAPGFIVPAICTFLTDLGSVNARALQVAGALDTVDCGGCSNWCHKFDFRLGAQGWVLNPDGFTNKGVYVGGAGWESTLETVFCPGDPFRSIEILFNLPSAMVINRVELEVTCPDAAGVISCISQHRQLNLLLAGALVSANVQEMDVHPACEANGGVIAPVTADQYGITWLTAGPGSPDIICSATLGGPGINPFGADNCV